MASVYRMREIECTQCGTHSLQRCASIYVCDKLYCTHCKDFTPFVTFLEVKEVQIPAVLGDFGADEMD